MKECMDRLKDYSYVNIWLKLHRNLSSGRGTGTCLCSTTLRSTSYLDIDHFDHKSYAAGMARISDLEKSRKEAQITMKPLRINLLFAFFKKRIEISHTKANKIHIRGC
uniref:Uncharacterized protein n=1 Tax=Oryza brachyantha TaxID=4533 RepID=J3NCR9_ORYBR